MSLSSSEDSNVSCLIADLKCLTGLSLYFYMAPTKWHGRLAEVRLFNGDKNFWLKNDPFGEDKADDRKWAGPRC